MKLCDNNKGYLPTIFLPIMLLSLILFTILFDYSRQEFFASAAITEKYFVPLLIGNREVNLSIKVSTPNKTMSSSAIQLRLFDTSNNQTIQHVTYDITLTKGTNQAGPGTKPILRDFFHAHNGIVTLKIEPVNSTGGQVTVYGERDPFQNAWLANPEGVINLRGQILLNSGLYHFHVEIFGIDNDRNLFIPDQAPKFDSTILIQTDNIYDNYSNIEAAKILIDDAVDALKNNDTGKAIMHMNLANQQLGLAGSNSTLVETVKVFITDSIRALKENDNHSTMIHLKLASQQLSSFASSRAAVKASVLDKVSSPSTKLSKADINQTTMDIYNVNFYNMVYPVKYTIIGGHIDSITRDSASHLFVNLNGNLSSSNGKLTIEIPRKLLDSRQNGTEIPFTVLVPGTYNDLLANYAEVAD
jgi:hypothetical protein